MATHSSTSVLRKNAEEFNSQNHRTFYLFKNTTKIMDFDLLILQWGNGHVGRATLSWLLGGTGIVQHVITKVYDKVNPQRTSFLTLKCYFLSIPFKRKGRTDRVKERTSRPGPRALGHRADSLTGCDGDVWDSMCHTHTFWLGKIWIVFNGNLLCFFQVLFSPQTVFCLIFNNKAVC